jgi:hypothetical protein
VKNKYKSYKDDVAYSKALDYFDDSDFKNFMKTARLLTAEEPDPKEFCSQHSGQSFEGSVILLGGSNSTN